MQERTENEMANVLAPSIGIVLAGSLSFARLSSRLCAFAVGGAQ